LDWSKLPNLFSVAVLACAFASIARRSATKAATLWLVGWTMITVHVSATLFLSTQGVWGTVAADVHLASLASAGTLFSYASVPHRKSRSSKWMLIVLLGFGMMYIVTLNAGTSFRWALSPAALGFALGPIAVALTDTRALRQPLRWFILLQYLLLAIYLMLVQYRPAVGYDLALNGLLFVIYAGCCIHFWYAYRQFTASTVITATGFGAWAITYLIAPFVQTMTSVLPITDAIWDVPKYIVAVGMILILFEGQLEHSKYLALHDELTGLPNRRLFLDRLAIAVERARRMGSKTALLVVDLDHFKRVNDSLGHHAGDIILRQVGAVFTSRVRRSDTVARTGGDEFCVILEEPTDRAQARQVAHSLMVKLNQPQSVEGHTVWIGASIGIAVFPDDANDIEALCVAADLRMYSDKRSNGHDNVSSIDSKSKGHTALQPAPDSKGP
jgi:diguanylate cyclase (GGDEF)-like protein